MCKDKLMCDYTLIFKENCMLGEGPVWCESKGCLYFVDIDGQKLHSVDWATKKTTTTPLPQKTGSIALTTDDDLIFAMEDGVYSSDFKLLHLPETIRGRRFNDGKVGPDGKFYVGTISDSGDGALYCLSGGVLTPIIEKVSISNGIDWSPDGKTVYYCDTATQKIVAYDFPHFNNKREIITISPLMGKPDGLCVDTEGCIWLALWEGSAVIRISPDRREIVQKLVLPATKTSCPCFVGNDLNELVVTSASVGINVGAEPYAGCTFLVGTNFKGNLSYKFKY